MFFESRSRTRRDSMPPIRTPPSSRANASANETTASLIVVDELLCFIQNKIEEVDIINICTTAYSEDEIEKARRWLCDRVGKRTTRKGEGSGKRSVQEIIKSLKEYEDDELPEFVARDLNRLPPVTFDHVDVTAFLKEPTVLRRDVALLKESTETPQQSRRDLSASREEISCLKRDIQAMTFGQQKVQLPANLTIAPPRPLAPCHLLAPRLLSPPQRHRSRARAHPPLRTPRQPSCPHPAAPRPQPRRLPPAADPRPRRPPRAAPPATSPTPQPLALRPSAPLPLATRPSPTQLLPSGRRLPGPRSKKGSLGDVKTCEGRTPATVQILKPWNVSYPFTYLAWTQSVVQVT